MLYINYGESKKRLYINVKSIGKGLVLIGVIVAYLYVSNLDYLTLMGK